MTRSLHVVVGPRRSGCTTLAKRLCRERGAVMVTRPQDAAPHFGVDNDYDVVLDAGCGEEMERKLHAVVETLRAAGTNVEWHSPVPRTKL